MNKQSSNSTFFFPLRTNVEYFTSPEGFLTLERRVKQAAILYDVIILEGGIYTASAGPTGSMDFWISPSQVTDEELRLKLEPSGGQHHLALAPTGSRQFQTVVSGPVERRFRSEFHSILKKLGPEYPKWIKMETYDLTSAAKSLASRISRNDEKNTNIAIPEGSHFLRNIILRNLNRDLILAGSLGSMASIDPLHLPILQKKMAAHGGLRPASGFVALEVAVPDLSEVPWDVIAEVREHKAMMEFRHRIVQTENLVRTSLPDADDAELRFQISQIITNELLNEIKNLRPTVKGVVANLTLDLLSGLIPPPWSAVSTLALNTPEIGKLFKTRTSWITMFMKLRTSKQNP